MDKFAARPMNEMRTEDTTHDTATEAGLAPPLDGAPAPLVSVVMANFRGADHLEDAMRSVLEQSHRKIELIVSDDASDDDSCAIVRRIATSDSRVKLIEAATNSGPARARNAALAVARGEWIAIVDADDLLHPDRITLMLAAARHHRANAVADDMLPFGEAVARHTQSFYAPLVAAGPIIIGAADLLREETPMRRAAPLGYLKPLIQRSFLKDRRFDETLRNGEDFDLYLRLVLGGARLLLLPDTTYFYRRHAVSVSHRLSAAVLEPLIAAHDRVARNPAAQAPEIRSAMAARRAALARALRYAQLVAALKSGRAITAAALLVRHPLLVSDLRESLRDRRNRRRAAEAAPKL